MTPENKSVPSVMSDKSVSTLESLVPPLDLCRKIPPGAFEDSVLEWFGVKNHDSTMEVVPRLELGETCKMFLKKGLRILYPAPTLQEILAEFTSNKLDVPAIKFDGNSWRAFYAYHNSGNPMCPHDDSNPATAALKLWLELNPPEVKP